MNPHAFNPFAPGPRRGHSSWDVSRGGSRGGIVLFVVMIVIVMISLAGLSFVITMSTENKAVHLCGDELQIEQVVASGEELLKAFCELSLDERQQAGGSFDNPELFRSVLVVDDQPSRRRARFSIVSPRIEEERVTGIRFGVVNESARLNLAVLAQWEDERAGAARNALMNLPGMTEPIAEAILDWIDVDPTPRPSGAEAEYYASLGVPYRPRNGIPTSLDELLLIRDVSRALLFGADADFNYQVEPTELELAASGAGTGLGENGLPWAMLLTVYSAERNTSYEGSPRINLNQKDLAKLHEQLSEVFELSWARFIIAYRQFGPYEESSGGQEDPAADRAPFGGRSNRARRAGTARPGRRGRNAPELDLSQPARFQIASVLDLVGARVQLGEPDESQGDAQPSGTRPPPVLDSPFPLDRLAMRDYLPKLIDHTTVTSDKVIRGRINVNEAPRAVLLGVPGLSRSTVDRIIAARRLRLAAGDASRRHAIWLVTEGIVELDQMKALGPYLTTGGDVFRGQVVGYFEESGPWARAEVVVDGTTSPPRQVYWKNLRLLGRGYSPETLGAEAASDTTGVSTEAASPGPLPQLD